MNPKLGGTTKISIKSTVNRKRNRENDSDSEDDNDLVSATDEVVSDDSDFRNDEDMESKKGKDVEPQNNRRKFE